MESKTSLWNQVEKTDPAYTSQFTGPGGFSGTAICGAYLAKRATEVFGPCGLGWGFEVQDEKYVSGYVLGFDAEGNSVGTTVVHVIRLKLWYMLEGKRGEVTQFGQTTFVGRNKNGLFHDEDAPKKSITDAISKCLSLLGFSADVHLGKYDDNKYVESLKSEFGDPTTLPVSQSAPRAPRTKTQAPQPGASTKPKTSVAQDINAWIRRIGVLGIDALPNARETAKSYFKDQELVRINEAITNREVALGAVRTEAAA
jgi:hypothetical protein